jgi:hypothetical protein
VKEFEDLFEKLQGDELRHSIDTLCYFSADPVIRNQILSYQWLQVRSSALVQNHLCVPEIFDGLETREIQMIDRWCVFRSCKNAK